MALLASPLLSQRPALTGEKARVAEAVRADLTKLGELQAAHHARIKVFAADLRDLSFAPTSGATINIAYASMNAWAANATHPSLSPVACYIIISSAEPTGPASEPFCQEGRPGSPAPATVASTPPRTPPPMQRATAPTSAPESAPAPAQRSADPATSPRSTAPTAAPSTQPPAAPPATVSSTPATPAPRTAREPVAAPPTATAPAPRVEQVMSPAAPAAQLPAVPSTAPAATGPAPTGVSAPAGLSEITTSARSATREASAAGLVVSQQVENVTAAQFSTKLNEFAQGVTAIFTVQASEIVRLVKDPYESTAEFEARRTAALAAAQRREQEFFQQNSRTYNVAMPIRDVRYDADREVLEFTVDGLGLPLTRTVGDQQAEPTLTFACYTRPVFWCSAEDGMTYDAGDLWRIPRATARQHDVLRSPLVLYARFAVGRRSETQTLAISLISMDLHARGVSVQRWDGSR